MRPMHSLFRRTFIAFISSFAVLLVVLGGALVAGYNHSLSTWSARRVLMVEEAARRILTGAAETGDAIPQDIPVFVYDRHGTLVVTNRGVGRRREGEQDERMPVRENDTLLGYFSVGTTAFRNDAANRALAQSLVRAAAAGAVAAFGAAMVAAWGFARSLTSPAARVAEGIDSIAYRTPAARIPEVGAEEIARIARAANTLATRLGEEQRLRSQWAQDVTHDLRTPIASIRAQLEAIVDGVYPADAETVKATLAELGRMERLIVDLEELMRLEQPDVTMNVTTFSAEDFTETLRQRFQHEIEKKRIAWIADLRVFLITADETLLYRAVSNVVSNAVRHAASEGRVRLLVEPAPHGRLRLAVTNDGPPIPSEELDHLFERLYRGEYARNTEGSGLGLTIARRIVLLHNGTIEITSTAAGGTTVSITLPQ